MTPEQMKQRTKAYAIRIVKLVDALPNTRICSRLGQQLLDAGTSVGANYRAVCRAKSRADFINKLRIVEEECDESLYWMEILIEAGQIKPSRLHDLMNEGAQILAIVVASAKTARNPTGASIVNRQS
jgi:four helix bundle protein